MNWQKPLIVGGAVVGAAAAPFVVVPALGLLGFSGTGIVAGTWAASFMSSYGGTVAAGSACAVMQSIGATGLLGAAGTAAACAAGGATVATATAGVTAVVAAVSSEDNQESARSEKSRPKSKKPKDSKRKSRLVDDGDTKDIPEKHKDEEVDSHSDDESDDESDSEDQDQEMDEGEIKDHAQENDKAIRETGVSRRTTKPESLYRKRNITLEAKHPFTGTIFMASATETQMRTRQ